MSNIFEKIIAGEIPADIVHRDDEVVAFRDINPAAPVHILIVPVKPIPTVDDIADEDAALLGKMILTARDIARREGVEQDGYRLLFNCRAHGGQEIFHLHLHLIAGRPLGPMVAPE